MEYSKSIKRLREDKNLTVDELAKRLSLDANEIQKAEDGEDNLDEKTLESLARYFGVPYESILEGTANRRKKETIFDPTEWYKLDNAAKVYPSSSSNEYSALFRFAAVMKERDIATGARRSRPAFSHPYGDDKARSFLVLF